MPRTTTRPADKNVMSPRELNRALLARQMLIKRRKVSATRVIEHLVGMQSQLPNSPYVGLWSRIIGFRHSELARLYDERKVVRIAMMRSTIHLVTAADCLSLRPVVQQVLDRSSNLGAAKTLSAADHDEIEAIGRSLVEAEPITFNDLGRRLNERWPDRHGESMARAIRTRIPLVQVPPRGIWGKTGQATHTSAELWLGQPLNAGGSIKSLVLRYLAAFGPATVMDAQAWSGLTRLADTFDELRPTLVTFRDEKGREVFDIPTAPRPGGDTGAPVRFLPEFDNVLLAYKDRSRIIADKYRPRIYPNNGMIQPSILVDGFVQGKWKIFATGKKATLTIEAFRRFTKNEKSEIEAEGKSLLEFVAENSKARDVKVSGP